MAISQLTISESDLGAVISRLVSKNFYVTAATHVANAENGYMGVVNDDYQGDTNDGIVRIGIQKMKRFDAASRTLGAVSNGGFKNTDAAKTISNTTIALTLDQVFDPKVEVPELQRGFLMFNTASNIAYNISGDLVRQIDTYTSKVIYDGAVTFGTDLDTPFDNFVKTANNASAALATSAAKTALISADLKLTELPVNDYDLTTPYDNRAVIATQEFINNLRETGISIVGSEFAFKTYIKGIEGYDLDSLSDEVVVSKSYKGSYLGFNVFQILSSFLPTPTTGEIYAIATHFIATTRAISPEKTKIVNTVDAMGLMFQYLTTYGAYVVKPWMVVPIVSVDWTEIDPL